MSTIQYSGMLRCAYNSAFSIRSLVMVESETSCSDVPKPRAQRAALIVDASAGRCPTGKFVAKRCELLLNPFNVTPSSEA